MKKAILTSAIFLMIFGVSFAQKTKIDTVTIQTSGQCGMCKDRIEKALVYEKGVKKSNYDLATAKVTVIYNLKKTSHERICKAITDLGHDADDHLGEPKAYSKLPECCKKPVDKHQHGSGCDH